MHIKLTPGRVLAAATVILSVWILHAFVQAVLGACVIAIASWPLYARFKARLPRRLDGAAPAVFTCVLTAFVLAPMAFAFASLLVEAHSMLSAIAAANGRGLAVPDWVANAPVVGPWAAARWQSELARDRFDQLMGGRELDLPAGHQVLDAACKGGGCCAGTQLEHVGKAIRILGCGVENHR